MDLVGDRTGAFRPQLNCLMRELHRGYCRICLGRLDRYLATLKKNAGGGGSPCGEELRGDGQCDPCLGDDCDCDDGGGGGGGDGSCGDGTCAQDETDAECPADCGCAASSCGISPVRLLLRSGLRRQRRLLRRRLRGLRLLLTVTGALKSCA